MSKDTEGKSEKIMDMESKVLWYPDSKRNTEMDKFRIQVNQDYGLNLGEWGSEGGSQTGSRVGVLERIQVGLLSLRSCITQPDRKTETSSISPFCYVSVHVLKAVRYLTIGTV